MNDEEDELRPSGRGYSLIDDSVDEDGCTPAEAKMRRSLKYFFMTPCEKYRAKGRIPYKMFMQCIKIVVITVQLILFGYNSSSHVNFTERNIVSFRHLYLKGWDASFETLPYPPSTGAFAVYTYDDFYDMLDFAMTRYNNTLKIALGAYDFSQRDSFNMSVCKKFYREGHIFAFNQSYIFDSHEETTCNLLHAVEVFNETTNTTEEKFDSRVFFRENNMTINFDRMIEVWLFFSLKSIQLKAFDYDQSPDCYRFDIKIYTSQFLRTDQEVYFVYILGSQITFENRDHNGQILVHLNAGMRELMCRGHVHTGKGKFTGVIRNLITALDSAVILLSVLSAVLCIRSHMRCWMLYKKTRKFFKQKYDQDLNQDRWEFLNLWYVLIIINDVLIICGSIYKIQLDNKAVDDYNMCSYMLGLGSLLVWLGVIRYLGFSYKTNILILTLRKAGPNVIRFVFCAMVIYMAFALCAWIVLGPYHVKFRNLFSTLECLFSLVNGDDMYTTFSIIKNDGSFIFFFSRIYLYSFISLFIYVVLNLFITLIIEAYEEVKNLRFNKGRSDTYMWQFIRRCPDTARSRLFLSDDLEDALLRGPSMPSRLARQAKKALCRCCKRRRSDSKVGYSERDTHVQDGQLSYPGLNYHEDVHEASHLLASTD